MSKITRDRRSFLARKHRYVTLVGNALWCCPYTKPLFIHLQAAVRHKLMWALCPCGCLISVRLPPTEPLAWRYLPSTVPADASPSGLH